MGTRESADMRRVTGGVRALLIVFGTLTLLAFVVLYLQSEHTDQYFAWTIQPPLTAAFLGGSYGAGCVLVVYSLRQRVWANARVGFITILVFVVLTLVATVVHLGNFHFGVADSLPRLAAWFWLAIYVGVPVAMVALLARQRRMPGADPPVRRPLPGWLKVLLAVHGAVMFVTGVALFLIPDTAAGAWPWMLTPLTARAVGAWLIALGAAAGHAIVENDLTRLRAAALTYTVLGAVQLIALVRFPGQVQWHEPGAWLYVLMATAVLATGLYGWTTSAHSATTLGATRR